MLTLISYRFRKHFLVLFNSLFGFYGIIAAEVLTKMHAPPKDESIPIATAAALEQYDGIIWGIPTRYGMAAAQMKAFMDSTGQLWQAGKLIGKPAGIFFSTGTQNGGQETTGMLTALFVVQWNDIF